MRETLHPVPVPDFNQAPYLILWELTRACTLACRHCRARAMRGRDPRELSTEEVTGLLQRFREFGHPLLVFTGGDPIERPDLFAIIRKARQLGFTVAMTPSATAKVTRDIIAQLHEAGLARLAISIDGADEQTHDSFRRVTGSFRWTMDIISWANHYGVPLQINSTMCRHNSHQFDAMAKLADSLGAVLWSVFFLVPVGRARQEMQLTAGEAESILRKMADLTEKAPFDVKATAAPQFRRILIERFSHKAVPAKEEEAGAASSGLGQLKPALKLGALRSYQSVNDGKGLLFISHTGDIQPSGFLPISAGNVRTQSVLEVYRDHKLFTALRNPTMLNGKCGACRYRALCGGSRARAYAHSGDYLSEDPLCPYQEQSLLPPAAGA